MGGTSLFTMTHCLMKQSKKCWSLEDYTETDLAQNSGHANYVHIFYIENYFKEAQNLKTKSHWNLPNL